MKPHATTQKAPLSEWNIERASLTPFTATAMATPSKLYMVRKDNIISWKGSFYTLPSGTYKGRGTQVKVFQDNGLLVISSVQDIHISTHPISNEKGKLVSNTDHKRQKSDKIDKMVADISLLFESPVLALQYMENIKREKPRYIRDQLTVIKQTTQNTDTLVINQALQYCINMKVFSANDFKSVVTSLLHQNAQMETLDSNPVLMNPLNGNRSTQSDFYPMKSSINDYELLMVGGK